MIERKQALLIAAEASVDYRTVEKVYAGEKSERKTQVRRRIVQAAKKLKIPAPPMSTSRAK